MAEEPRLGATNASVLEMKRKTRAAARMKAMDGNNLVMMVLRCVVLLCVLWWLGCLLSLRDEVWHLYCRCVVLYEDRVVELRKITQRWDDFFMISLVMRCVCEEPCARCCMLLSAWCG